MLRLFSPFFFSFYYVILLFPASDDADEPVVPAYPYGRAPAPRSFLQCDYCDEYSCRDCSGNAALPDGASINALALAGSDKTTTGPGQPFFQCADCEFTICEACCT